MTELQPYEVVDRRDGFELRRYPAHLVAKIEVDGSFDEAPYRAFRPLAGFVNGASRSRRRIAMTAPVTQQEAGPEKIAIAAPLMQQAAGLPGSCLVQFVMPSHFTAQTLPRPEDTRVRTRQIPRQLAAAARFSGRWTHVRGSRTAGRRCAGPWPRQGSARPALITMSVLSPAIRSIS